MTTVPAPIFDCLAEVNQRCPVEDLTSISAAISLSTKLGLPRVVLFIRRQPDSFRSGLTTGFVNAETGEILVFGDDEDDGEDV